MRGCAGGLTGEAKTVFAKLYMEASKCAAAEPSSVKGSVEFPKVDAKTPCVQLVHPMTFP